MTTRRFRDCFAIRGIPASRVPGRLAAAAGAVALIGALLPAPLMLAAGTVPSGAASVRSLNPTSAPREAPADLARALGADGTFRGAPGLTGTVDTSAWTLVSDPATGGAPRFAPAASTARTVAPASIAGPWSAIGSNGAGTDGALNGPVYAIAVSGTSLYVGGYITNVAGMPGVNDIAKWNGVAWSSLGGPYALDGIVTAIAISGSNVYVGGHFTNAGGNAKADYVARWNGSSWSNLGSNAAGTDGALNNWVRAIAVSDTGDVYVGGDFEDAAGIAQADFVARWDGSAWFALGSDVAGTGGAINDMVYALAYSGTDLYVGGAFTDAAGITWADSIARWDGAEWYGFPGTTNWGGGGAVENTVGAIAVSDTDLYIGGAFTNVNTDQADFVAKWDGSSWSALGSGSPNGGALYGGAGVYALAVIGTDVYVGGTFTDAAGIATADHIARWDGAAWNAVGSNVAGTDGALNMDVYALAPSVSGSSLYAGGAFTDAAGNARADNLALWGPPPPVVRKPDGWIRLGTGAYVGNNVYNTTATGQSRTGSALRGHTVTFGIAIQNDGSGAMDRFKVKATGTATTTYTVKYYRGTTDITAAVVAGTYTTASLAPGATFLITAKVTVKSTAAVGSKVTRLVTFTSVGNSAKKDAVQFIGKRA